MSRLFSSKLNCSIINDQVTSEKLQVQAKLRKLEKTLTFICEGR